MKIPVCTAGMAGKMFAMLGSWMWDTFRAFAAEMKQAETESGKG
jgi:hypothetical protein